jgi:3-methylcrotonyl-CoA carboxylase alpha subunit/geranyl-CoA carboxylase alpha subunit
MLGKLIVHAPTRAQAIDALRTALHETRVLGVHTNRAFLAACLDHPTFRAGEARVPFLQTAADGLRDALHDGERAALVPAVAAVCASGAGANAGSLSCAYTRPVRVRHRDAVHAMGWHVARDGAVQIERSAKAGDAGEGEQGPWRLLPVSNLNACSMGNSPFSNERRQGDTHGFFYQADDQTHAVFAQRVGADGWHVQASGGAELWLDDLSLHPARQGGAAGAGTELRAPFNGRVIRVDASAGDALAAGAVVVVIESMKLEHALSVPADAQVAEVLVEVGQQVSPGQLLVRFAVPEAVAAGA